MYMTFVHLSYTLAKCHIQMHIPRMLSYTNVHLYMTFVICHILEKMCFFVIFCVFCAFSKYVYIYFCYFLHFCYTNARLMHHVVAICMVHARFPTHESHMTSYMTSYMMSVVAAHPHLHSCIRHLYTSGTQRESSCHPAPQSRPRDRRTRSPAPRSLRDTQS